MQVIHEHLEHLRSGVGLGAGVVYASIGVYSAYQVDSWIKSLDADTISVVTPTPLPLGEAHIRKLRLVDGYHDSAVVHGFQNELSTLLPQNEASLGVALPADLFNTLVFKTEFIFHHSTNEGISHRLGYSWTNLLPYLVNIPNVFPGLQGLLYGSRD